MYLQRYPCTTFFDPLHFRMFWLTRQICFSDLNRGPKLNVRLGAGTGLWHRAWAGFGLWNEARLQLCGKERLQELQRIFSFLELPGRCVAESCHLASILMRKGSTLNWSLVSAAADLQYYGQDGPPSPAVHRPGLEINIWSVQWCRSLWCRGASAAPKDLICQKCRKNL